MGKFFTKISEAKTKTKSVIAKPLSVSMDTVKLKNKPLSVTSPTKVSIVPKKRPKKEIISLPNPRPGSVGAHTLNLVTNQRVDFKPKKDVRYTIGKLRKKNMMGETQYGISFTKKF